MKIKKILAGSAMLFALASWAAVDANKASDAELAGIKGVGPALSKRITDARAKGAFKDWPDFMARVSGVKEKSAAKLSAEGLTVDGKSFGQAPAAPAAATSAAKAPAAQPIKASAAIAPAAAKPGAPARSGQ